MDFLFGFKNLEGACVLKGRAVPSIYNLAPLNSEAELWWGVAASNDQCNALSRLVLIDVFGVLASITQKPVQQPAHWQIQAFVVDIVRKLDSSKPWILEQGFVMEWLSQRQPDIVEVTH